MNEQLPPNINVSIENTTELTCEKCKGEIFQSGFILRRVSKLLTGQNSDGLIPIPVFYCTSCGHVNNEFLPQLPKKEFKKLEIIR